MLYTVYQTRNLKTGHLYVGVHVTKDPNDSYLGSGDRLKAAIRKYGRASFKKEVLFVFDNAEDMAAKEAEIVTREFVDREDTYNLVPGGFQGDAWYQGRKEIVFDPEDMSQRGKSGNEAFVDRLKSSPTLLADYQNNARRLAAKLISEGRLNPPPSWSGKTHSEATLRKMRESKKGLYDGGNNPVFGTIWVHRPGEPPKRIRKEELHSYSEGGWMKGRVSRPVKNGPYDGVKNHRYGTVWVSKLGENPKAIPAPEVQAHIESGWVRGRKIMRV
jgi:hypothetical protein